MLTCYEDALSALRQLSGGGAEAVADVYLWVVQVQQRQSQGDPLTILEHIALAYASSLGSEVVCRVRYPAPKDQSSPSEKLAASDT